MTRYRWARWGDINAFFGLILDNVAVMIVLVVLVTSAQPVAEHRFSREFVLTQMIPGTALGVVLGDLAYTWMAFRLARRTGRSDVTAMPLGLDTPSTFAIGALVLLPALNDGMTRYGLDHGQAMVFGWHVGAVVLLLVGAFKSVLAPLGGKIRRWVPRAGLLGSLAGIALALIAFLPLWTHIAAVPVVGFLSLTVILVALVARHRLPGRIPGALAAVLLGVLVYYLGDYLGRGLGVAHRAAARPPCCCSLAGPGVVAQLFMEPALVATGCVAGPGRSAGDVAVCPGHDRRRHRLHRKRGGGRRRVRHAYHPLDRRACVDGGRGLRGCDSKHPLHRPSRVQSHGRPRCLHAGDGDVHRRRRHVRLVHALVRVVARGSRVSRFWSLSAWRLPPSRFGRRRNVISPLWRWRFCRHWLTLCSSQWTRSCLTVRSPPIRRVVVQSLRCLANGFIVTSLLWASALAAMLDGKLARSAGYLGIAGICSLFGIIHSPLRPAAIALPQHVLARCHKSPPSAASRRTIGPRPTHWRRCCSSFFTWCEPRRLA